MANWSCAVFGEVIILKVIKDMLTDRATQVRFFRFMIVGSIAAIVQFTSLAVLVHLLSPTPAFTLSFACSTFVHYLMNRFWALRSSRLDQGKQAAEYLLAVAVSYIVNIAMFTVCRTLIGLEVLWSAIIALPPSTIIVFLLLNFRVFRK